MPEAIHGAAKPQGLFCACVAVEEPAQRLAKIIVRLLGSLGPLGDLRPQELLAGMFGEFALGQLSDRLGRKPILVVGLLLFSAQFIGLVIFHEVGWIVLSFILAGLGNALYDLALSAHLLDITPPEHTARIMGLKAMAGSIGNMLGPGLVVLFTSFLSPQVVFMIASALVLTLTLACGFALRVPTRHEVTAHFPNPAVSR